MNKKFVLALIDGEIIKCKAVAYYKNDTVRVEFPIYHLGHYSGIRATTISKLDIVGEW